MGLLNTALYSLDLALSLSALRLRSNLSESRFNDGKYVTVMEYYEGKHSYFFFKA